MHSIYKYIYAYVNAILSNILLTELHIKHVLEILD